MIISLLPGAMDPVSDVAKGKVLHTDREILDAGPMPVVLKPLVYDSKIGS